MTVKGPSARRRLAPAVALFFWAVSPGSALRLGTDDEFALDFDARGQVVGMAVGGRPAPTIGRGGWEFWDEADGEDEVYELGLDERWPEENDWQLKGPMWRLGEGWELTGERFGEGPVVRLEKTSRQASDSLRLLFPAPARAVLAIKLFVRATGLDGPPRLGAMPINAVGQASAEWVPFDWAGAPRSEGEWFPVSCLLAPTPATSLVAVYVALEETVGRFEVGGAEVTVHSGASLHRFEGEMAAEGSGAVYTASAAGMGLEVRYQAMPDHLRARATLLAEGSRDRAVTVVFRVPLKGAGWEWWDTLNARAAIPDAGGRLFGNWRHLGGGHLYSPYPLCCVTRSAPAGALALAVPLSQPILTRFAFRLEEGLSVAFDLGFSPRLDQRRVDLELAIYAPDATWGLRGALDRYYGIYDQDVVSTTSRAGAWFTAVNPEALPDPGRLGLLFDEQAGPHLPWSRAGQVVALGSLQPWGLWRREGDPARVSADGIYPTGVVQEVEVPPGAALLDADRKPVVYRASDGTQFVPWTTAPERIPDGPAGRIWALLAARLQGPEGERLDGVFLQGVGAGWAGWQVDDYDPDHLRRSRVPLTYSKVTRRPVLYSGIAHLEMLQAISQRLRAEGKVVMASLDDRGALPFAVPWLDVVGGGEMVPSEEHLMWLRAVARHKPVTFLEPAVLDSTAMFAEQEAIWRRATSWGAFPGAAGWLSRIEVAQHSGLFEAYALILRDLAASWEPVPHAFVNDAQVDLERFGQGDELHLVLRNRTAEPRVVALTLNPHALGLITIAPDGMVQRRLLFANRLSLEKRPLELAIVLDRWQTSLELGPYEVAVLAPFKPRISLDPSGMPAPLP